MKRTFYYLYIIFFAIWLPISGCVIEKRTPIDSLNVPNLTPSISPMLTSSQDVTGTSPFFLDSNFTVTPFKVVIPSSTISVQESEMALTILLKTNGYCVGKCVAGIKPDNMTFQDAVNKIAEWGAIEIDENPRTGKVFVHLIQSPINEQVYIDLSVGTGAKEMKVIDTVFLHISGPPENLLLEKDVWLTNYDAWSGIRIDNILKTYGIPSYVGYFFQTTTGALITGRNINYTLVIQYEEMSLIIIVGGLASYDGKSLFLCQTEDPHDLALVINPEQSLEKYRGYAQVTWQALTNTTLDAFYQKFTNDPKACIKTSLTVIQELQPSFR
jgi:hypothetical protein